MVATNLHNFRRSVGWSLAIHHSEVSPAALGSGMHHLHRDQYGRAVVVYNPELLDRNKETIERYQHMGMYVGFGVGPCAATKPLSASLLVGLTKLTLANLR